MPKRILQPEAPYLEEKKINTLLQRVGVMREDRLRWALDFCQEDWAPLTPPDLQNRALELAIFLFIAWMPNRAPSAGGMQGYWPCDLRELPKAYLAGRALLDELEKKGKIRLGPYTMHIELTLHRQRNPKARQSDKQFFGDPNFCEDFFCRELIQGYSDRLNPKPEVAFPYCLAHLLGRFNPQVGRCAEAHCKRWFIARRTTKEFCGDTCKSRNAMRAMRLRQKQ